MSREWYPEILIDEYLPTPRARAEEWLEPNAEGKTDISFSHRHGMMPVATWSPGETVKFQWCEPRGELTVLIMPDGSIGSTLRCPHTYDMFDPSVTPQPTNIVPPDANAFYDYASETFAKTVEEFARQYSENSGGYMDEDGETVTLVMSHWSGPLSFIISADGKSLTPVSEASNHVHG